MLSRSTGSLLALSILFLFFSACPEVKDTRPTDYRVSLEWSKNEKKVESALSGKKYITEDFLNACIFFQRLTGIKISGDLSYIGLTPTNKSRDDFVRVQKWYAENKAKLCWDEQSGSVKLCKDISPSKR